MVSWTSARTALRSVTASSGGRRKKPDNRFTLWQNEDSNKQWFQGMPILSSVISEFMERAETSVTVYGHRESMRISTADLSLLKEQLKVLDSQVGSVLNQKSGQVSKPKE